MNAGGPEPASPADDPLADYLDQMDAAFDRFEAEKSVASGRGRPGAQEPRLTPKDASASEEKFDSLEGALSVLEGAIDQLGLENPDAKADGAPAGLDVSPTAPDAASSPPDRTVGAPVPTAGSGVADDAPATPVPPVRPPSESVARVASALDPTSEVVSELTSLTEVLRRRDKKVADATTKLRRTIAGALHSWAKEVGADDIASDVLDRVRDGFDVDRDDAAGKARTQTRRAAKKAGRSAASKGSEKVRRATKRKTTRKTTREKTVREKE